MKLPEKAEAASHVYAEGVNVTETWNVYVGDVSVAATSTEKANDCAACASDKVWASVSANVFDPCLWSAAGLVGCVCLWSDHAAYLLNGLSSGRQTYHASCPVTYLAVCPLTYPSCDPLIHRAASLWTSRAAFCMAQARAPVCE